MTLSLLSEGSVRIRDAAPAQEQDSRLLLLVQAGKTANTPELDELLLARCEQNERIDKLLSKLARDARKKLESDHEETKRLVREKQAAIDDVQLQIDRLDQRAGQLGNSLQKAEHALNRANTNAHALGRFAPKAEVIAAQKAIADAEAHVEKIQAELAAPENQARYHRLTTLPKMQSELQGLMAEEARLASAVSGEPYHHPSGLILPGGAEF